MKSSHITPLLSFIVSLTMFGDEAIQHLTAVSDSTQTKSEQQLQSHLPGNGLNPDQILAYPFQKRGRYWEAPPDNMKIFVPDDSLAASMPVFKPAPIDPKIFIPGLKCTDSQPSKP